LVCYLISPWNDSRTEFVCSRRGAGEPPRQPGQGRYYLRPCFFIFVSSFCCPHLTSLYISSIFTILLSSKPEVCRRIPTCSSFRLFSPAPLPARPTPHPGCNHGETSCAVNWRHHTRKEGMARVCELCDAEGECNLVECLGRASQHLSNDDGGVGVHREHARRIRQGL
jgi:hypothetical protein